MKKIIMYASLFLLLFTISCTQTNQKTLDPNDFILTTADEVNITAEYHETNAAERAVLLVHMLGHDKSDYDNLSLNLQKSGFTVLAIDLRGHGTSDLDYTTFTDADWQNLVLDVQAGVDYLEQKGYNRIGVVGASIGANAALKQGVQDTRIDALVLLSAGENYHNLTILDIAPFYTRPVMIVVALDDKDAAVAGTKLYNSIGTVQPNLNLKVYQAGGHGTDMLKNVAGADATIISWLWSNT
ncbi:alpha/beta fold hydrolase [Candidatus Woesearchaeota archaeon]|nr:alpha/beta fold hydrolase [Candidatus Woesearchaeota archaeon]